jgi:hypothetical protein
MNQSDHSALSIGENPKVVHDQNLSLPDQSLIPA